MPRYHTVLLDADNTVFDFDRSEREALRCTLTQWELPHGGEVLATYSKINQALWDAFARGEVDQDFLVVERFAALLRVLNQTRDARAMNHDYEQFLGQEGYFLPGAADFCRALNGLGVTAAIATNGLPAAQRGRYTRTGMDQLIPRLYISMELGVAKPQPAFFEKILTDLGLPGPDGVVMVGDSLNTDIAGGSRAGLDTIWFNPRKLPLTGPIQPTYTVAGYGELLDILR